jgi:hypothetical protein
MESVADEMHHRFAPTSIEVHCVRPAADLCTLPIALGQSMPRGYSSRGLFVSWLREDGFMNRVLVLGGAMTILVGCQTQNPYSAFGPPTVPAPASQPAHSYSLPAAPRSSATSPATNSRASVSAEGTTGPIASQSIATNPADSQPIRIVESPSKARSGHSPSGAAPANGGTGGYAPPSGSDKRSGSMRTDTSVVPAGYQQRAPTFAETPPLNGQWRAR